MSFQQLVSDTVGLGRTGNARPKTLRSTPPHSVDEDDGRLEFPSGPIERLSRKTRVAMGDIGCGEAGERKEFDGTANRARPATALGEARPYRCRGRPEQDHRFWAAKNPHTGSGEVRLGGAGAQIRRFDDALFFSDSMPAIFLQKATRGWT